MLSLSIDYQTSRSILFDLQMGTFPNYIESKYPQFLTLLKDMLSLDPDLRPSVKDILCYPLFSSHSYNPQPLTSTNHTSPSSILSSQGRTNIINNKIIDEQKNLLSEKDKEIENLSQQVSSLQQLCKNHGLTYIIEKEKGNELP